MLMPYEIETEEERRREIDMRISEIRDRALHALRYAVAQSESRLNYNDFDESYCRVLQGEIRLLLAWTAMVGDVEAAPLLASDFSSLEEILAGAM